NLLNAQRNKNADAVRNARERLKLWGVGDDQIEQTLKSGKANTHLNIQSPIEGHVLKKYVKEGQYVEEGSPLYDVADLSTVWIEGQVYEDDISFLPSQAHFHKDHPDKESDFPEMSTTLASPME